MFSRILSVVLNIVGFLILVNALTVHTVTSIHQIYVVGNFILAALVFILAKLMSK